MFRKGLAVAVILLFVGVAFAPTINANVSKSSLEPIVDVDVIEEDVATATPIQLVFQLIAKLRNHKDIQYVESEDDVLRIIEEDEELNSIYEKLSGNDCGCEEETTEWIFPVICILLAPFVVLSIFAGLMLHIYFPAEIMWYIGQIFNCPWA